MTDLVVQTLAWENEERFARFDKRWGTKKEPNAGAEIIRTILNDFYMQYGWSLISGTPPEPMATLDLQGECSVTRCKARPLSLIKLYSNGMAVIQCRPVETDHTGALILVTHHQPLRVGEHEYWSAITSFNNFYKYPKLPTEKGLGVEKAELASATAAHTRRTMEPRQGKPNRAIPSLRH